MGLFRWDLTHIYPKYSNEVAVFSQCTPASALADALYGIVFLHWGFSRSKYLNGHNVNDDNVKTAA